MPKLVVLQRQVRDRCSARRGRIGRNGLDAIVLRVAAVAATILAVYERATLPL
jgi:hypothetical protein